MNININDNNKFKNQHLRIADILADDDDGEYFVRDIGMECWSPRRIVARWLAAVWRRNKESSIVNVVPPRKTEEEEEEEKENEPLRTRGSVDGLEGHPGSSLSSSERQCREDASFNLGLGCSLLYLIAASKNELTKMVELRKEVEMLLQNVKVELQRKDVLCKPFESNDTIAYSTTDIQEGSNSNSRISLQSQTTSHVLQDSESIMVHDQLLISNHHQKEEHVEGMDELEAELVAELELLQIHLDRENSTKHPQQQRIKDTASVRGRSLSFGEVIDPQKGGTEMEYGVPPTELEIGLHELLEARQQERVEDTEMEYGVPPTELEIRLHELLEARQQERVEELEAALECTIHKLREKEIEVSWWKDTARLISQHVPGPSRFSS
ncbi:protein POLAR LOCALIZATION DURING ASYMMETRIC DIVISION AND REDISTRIBUTION-like [Quercus lobata]|uniref:Protein POLAR LOCALIZATION DURING ASYMMETRIC DIVISION AND REDISTRIBUTION n=1 Tax=Quercus lobata TaxID=97700 RepID=A0A7N2KU44_QUELO|nr:protein POLAR LOCALIZATION DURING ASYMMETRIC DIVISION AND REDISTRIBUTION-like [Quercus lobata]